jgi:hypothetical protein
MPAKLGGSGRLGRKKGAFLRKKPLVLLSKNADFEKLADIGDIADIAVCVFAKL